MDKYDKPCLLEVERVIGDTESGNGLKVIIKATGKEAVLPKSEIQFFNGRFFVPEWLHNRVCPQNAGASI